MKREIISQILEKQSNVDDSTVNKEIGRHDPGDLGPGYATEMWDHPKS